MRLFTPLLAWSVVVGAQDAYAQFMLRHCHAEG